jgi:hypothetical protein
MKDKNKEIIDVLELNNSNYKLSNNGNGDRWCKSLFCYTSIYLNSRNYNTFNNKKNYELSNDDKNKIKKYRDIFLEKYKIDFEDKKIKKNSIIGIMIHYINEKKEIRPISLKIKKELKNKNCVMCGSYSSTVIDHKNDLYNDPRVLDVKTQCIDDFQVLCNHCNLQKRQISINEKKNNKIYSAKNLDRYKIYEFDFPWEKIFFDIKKFNTKNCSLWYDPIEFQKKYGIMNYIHYQLLNKLS